MTREEFMAHAREEIDRAFAGQRNRMMNLVEQAWAEGKRNAEVDALTDVVTAAIGKMRGQECAEIKVFLWEESDAETP